MINFIGLILGFIAVLAGPVAMGNADDSESMQTSPFNVFWSGHSLTASPIPDYVAGLSEASGTLMGWNYHTMAGAGLEDRTRGRPPQPDGWAGYQQGDNRFGSKLDIIHELRTAESIGGGHYDALVITEVHDFMWSLLERDSVRLLRHYHERFIDGNPTGQTHFYQAWLDVDDPSDPRNWIAYERAAAPVWQCMATRVNVSLAAEGRTDRLAFLPAGLALAELVERATSSNGLAGISTDSPGATLHTLLPDDVHLSPLGAYYIALVSHAFIRPGVAVPRWHPAEVSAAQAAALQQAAAEFVRDFRKNNQPLDLPACRAYIREDFAELYWRYIDSARKSSELTWYASLLERAKGEMRRVRNTRRWQQAFAEDAPNPLRFEPGSDRDWWHPAP